MIVECSNCQTRFQLDDSRVPLRGIRVRCSRCKEAFFLEHPNASQAEAVQDTAERAVSSGVPPDATQDLDPDSLVASRPASSEPEDEEDWEFNEEPLSGDPNSASDTAFMDPGAEVFETEVDDLDEDISDEEIEAQVPGLGIDAGPDDVDLAESDESGLDLDGGGDIGLADDPAPDSLNTSDDGEGEEESAFGEASDFSAQAVEAQSLAAEAQPPPEAGAAIPAAAPAVSLSSEDVGEPEDWDFFSDDEPATFESMDNAMGRAMDAVEADGVPVAKASRGPDLGTVRTPASPRSSLRTFGHTVGWMVTLVLLAAGITSGVFDQVAPVGRAHASVDLGDFRAEGVRGSWFETTRATRLYAVTGHLVNASDQARRPGAGLSVVLLDSAGSRLELPAAPAGVPLSEAQLRELPQGALADAAGRAVGGLAWVRLEPGHTVAFQALFDAIPDDAMSFTLELTSQARGLAPSFESPGAWSGDGAPENGSSGDAAPENGAPENGTGVAAATAGSSPAPSGSPRARPVPPLR